MKWGWGDLGPPPLYFYYNNETSCIFYLTFKFKRCQAGTYIFRLIGIMMWDPEHLNGDQMAQHSFCQIVSFQFLFSMRKEIMVMCHHSCMSQVNIIFLGRNVVLFPSVSPTYAYEAAILWCFTGHKVCENQVLWSCWDVLNETQF